MYILLVIEHSGDVSPEKKVSFFMSAETLTLIATSTQTATGQYI
jgi:hypothetical protein